MATEEEIKAEIDRMSQQMDHVNISDNVKTEVASAALVMECCLVVAGALLCEEIPGDETKIAIALFDSVVKRSMAQQPVAVLQHQDLRTGKLPY